ncbi:S8 family serine peptidase [Nonomuraea sp. NBC_01738]|uniref:S8 family serine peptidase n=1 Tax=Nonomuraea sp. NBC_01738 TaxID=2976003 RepID=UPI002E123268|nr:S8 family serine peptidase [Nonomuraea sp. NBC_01738]
MIIRTTLLALSLALPAAASPSTGPPPGPDVSRTVTLITGDRVSLVGDAIRIAPGPGRKSVTFGTEKVGGRLRVIPGDALPLLGGRVDPRLFDITTLLAFGYDDRRADLPLIVGGTALKGEGIRALPAGGGVAVRQAKKDAPRAWRDLLATDAKIWLDGKATLSLDASVKQIGAPAAWERGHTGVGVKVAVLDTGIDDTHPDLAGKVVARKNFAGVTDADVVGHGTHIASTIAGTGAASGGRYRGVAPGATLLDAKVCADRWCDESAILAGMQWVAEQGADIANISIGSPDTPAMDPLEEGVKRLTATYGTLFVAASGNAGQPGTVSSPASADDALAVGAVDRADRLARFSSTGPRAGDSGLKPDLTAPGVEIRAARSKDSPGEGSYTVMTGTSMATPHVAGAAAILAGQHPDWTPERLKAALMATARPQPGSGVFAQGAGRADLAGAVAQMVSTAPASVSFGRQIWPHDDDRPLARKVTYRNTASAPVTVKLAIRSDVSAFTVTPGTVTIPGGGEAEVTVTADTAGTATEGLLGGYLEATAEGVAVSTPVGVENEPESYDLTLNRLDAANATTTVYRKDVKAAGWNPVTIEPGRGTVTLRLAKGDYLVDSRTTGDRGTTMLVHPGLRLDKDQSLTLDPAAARPVTLTPPDPTAVHLLSEVTYTGKTLDGVPYFLGVTATMFDRASGLATAQIGPGDPLTKVSGQWAIPGPDGTLAASPAAYRLAWFPRGVPTGFTKQPARADLATVTRDYGVQRAGSAGSVTSGAWPAGDWFFNQLFATDIPLPFTHKEYVNAGDGARWKHYLSDVSADSAGDLVSPATRYRPGRAYAESWNRGVFGPSVLDDRDEPAVRREGDTIIARPSLHADGAGHWGISDVTTARIALYRDGELVAEQPYFAARFTVPPQEAAYRLEVTAERALPLSSRTSVTWTFRSAAGRDGALPVTAIGFAPRLDRDGTAPAGRDFTVPLLAPSGALSVEVSYDDGATWQAARVSKGAVRLRHPAAPGFVSLRARFAGRAGNTVDQTIIHAYRTG